MSANCRNRRHDWDALVMPDGLKRCPLCWTDAEGAKVKELEFRGLDIGLPWVIDAGVAWPYGPNIDVPARERLLSWADTFEVVHEDEVRHLCLPWLLGELARPGDCHKCWADGGPAISNRSWEDHPTRWTRDGKPALLLSHPYHLTEADRLELWALHALDGVEVIVRDKGESWYSNGTYQVEIWAAGA